MTDKLPAFQRVFSNAPWENQVGYCRALRAGNHIFLSGTAPVGEDGSTFMPGDPYAQTCRCLDLIGAALQELGAGFPNIVRTRMFVTDISLWQEYGRAHEEYFRTHPPTTAMVEINKLIDPEMMIEIEAEAIVVPTLPRQR